MSRVTRRKFLFTASTATLGAVILKGCTTAETPTASPSPTAAGTTGVEVDTVKLGYLPIVESAPLIIAKEKGFFAKHGLPNAEVSKQANWASARDNVVIGAAAGGTDGGQWQMPMPYLLNEGAITTNNVKLPMALLLKLNTQGNGIAISGSQKGKGIHLNIQDPNYVKTGLGRKFKAAFTFPKANQDFWIRYWLAANGINPDKDIELLTVPPAETVKGMQNGTMDAFSTGDPWPYRIVKEDIGFIGALTAQIWPYHPEEYLAIRSDWVEKNPNATKALMKAVMEAQQWCDDFANRDELVKIVSGRQYFNAPAEVLAPPFKGTYNMGDGQPEINDPKMAVMYWKDPNGNSISFPYKSLDLWFLTESIRWGFHKEAIKDLATAQALIDKVNRSDLWREAAQELGVPASDIPSTDSRGVEKFFDGVEFDPANPQKYLDSLKIKAA